MRLLSLEVERFGALTGTHHALDPRVVVVLGPNEAGKSSFHAALETVLYGFEPASRDKHPYAQWQGEGDALQLEAVVRLEPPDGPAREVRVERRLASSPTLRLADADADAARVQRARSNAPLAGLDDVPRKLFRAVWSLTANDTSFQADEVRTHVEELLLGPRALAGMRPAHEVRGALLEERRRLWRPDRTGNHRSLQIAKARTAAKAEAREAKKAEREAAEHVAERELLREEEARLRERRRTLARQGDEAHFLGQIAEWRRRADAAPPPPLEQRGGAPGAAPADPVELAAELERIEAELRPLRAALEEDAPQLPLARRALLHRADEVRAALEERADHEREKAEAAAAADRARLSEATARAHLKELGVDALDAAPPASDLRLRAAAWRGVRERAYRRPLGWAWALALAGVALSVAAALEMVPGALALPGVLLAVLPPILIAVDRARAVRPPAAVREYAKAGLEITGPGDLERQADARERAEAALGLAAKARAREAELSASCALRAERWVALARALDPEGPAAQGLAPDPSAVDAVPRRLGAALDAAREEEARLRLTRTQREHQGGALTDLEERRDAIADRLEHTRALLRESFPDLCAGPDVPWAAAFAAWRDARNEWDFLRRRERELAADERWEALRDDPRLDEAPAPWSAEARAAREVELEGLDERLREVSERAGELRKLLGEDDDSRLARAEEELRALDEEDRAVRRRHDRLALLERVLDEAERRHREAHQPDVLRRASDYLAAVTRGRYSTLAYPEGQEGVLHVESRQAGYAVPVGPPMSRGAREQVYLCLRLGTLDHLDRDRDRLPLLLDEALVHWDAERRSALYPLLAQVAEARQVVLFTCHPSFAEEAHAALGGTLLELQRSPVAD